MNEKYIFTVNYIYRIELDKKVKAFSRKDSVLSQIRGDLVIIIIPPKTFCEKTGQVRRSSEIYCAAKLIKKTSVQSRMIILRK